eukprot:TRINITY_DN56964_c0_g1_i1.p1 TRINITY_DN56964_c0_g1~~TRINITY_DN56964_c0_g1_i1.p1  ORF type:complete len:218 (-),score=76.50 TRINITY_DN56964_c0_g1_i1:117-770(-)
MSGLLVQKIKELQKNDREAKEQWGLYCEAMGNGIRDPARHDGSFLQEFITNFGAGLRFEPNDKSGGGKGGGARFGDTAELIKEGQRKSTAFKQAWGSFCEMNSANGKRDPAMHNNEFFARFFEFMGQHGMMAMGGAVMGMGPMGGGGGMPPQKRQRASTGDDAKDALIMRIKQMQRTSPDAKQMWWDYADSVLGGVRDPARHSVDVLEEFCRSHGVA